MMSLKPLHITPGEENIVSTQNSNSTKQKPVSLVPEYSSDSTLSDIENASENVHCKQNELAPQNCTVSLNYTRCSSSSSSTSSKSSSSSSTSSSSSSLSSSEPDNIISSAMDDTGLQNDESACEKIRLSDINSPTPEAEQPEVRSRERRINISVANYNISPIYTDQSDIDLSDEDPTINFNKVVTKPTKIKSLLFENSTSSDSDCSKDQNRRKGRKRTQNVDKWKQNKSKRLRNKGKSYVSMSKPHKTIPARYIKDTCTEKCRLKCAKNINDDERYNLFTNFWNLGNIVKQRAYIQSSMATVTPKYMYTNAENPRRPNKAFYFTINAKKIRVCKTFFKNTLSISERMVSTVQTKVNDGFMMDDLRGKHKNHKKINPVLLEDIRKHIDTIPKIESHYVRASTSKQYIEGNKTIKDLYNDFVAQQNETNRDIGNYIAYYKTFTKEFNLGFHQPKKDQCDLCVSYENSNLEQKQVLEEKFQKHLEEKSISRVEKSQDRQNVSKDLKVVVYDLEAVLQCPRGDTSAFYYKSKLNSYNLTLTELTNERKKAYNNVYCYFWTEVDANRGANEIGTCVWEYLKKVCAEDAEPKEFIFYSDNCCGQNKNKFIATLYMYAVNYLNITSITHKFLIRGQTQNEADSVHSLIEREVRKNLKSGPIYSPDQYIALIKNAKKSKPAINVNELTFDIFVDLKALQEKWGYNFNIDREGKSVNWNDIKVLKMVKPEPLSFYYKTSYKDSTFKEVDVRNKRKKMTPISEIYLIKAYSQKQKLSVNKKKDLKELITKGLIPSFYANFYDSLI
ncbi:hypothetical protein O3G_MSEX008752 [Manduca sexta]|uniref:DUF7869 domain-containing protein n=1 Tax=Manduca sexta TaxID=7130 RepID=A0A921ZD29_MANSE|nr:hypothetical protein O3G_MSEX008752 [Manduca sexta]